MRRLLLLAMFLAACSAPVTQPAPQAPGSPTAPAAQATQPTQLSPEEAMLATIVAGTTPTAESQQPVATVLPTITLGPKAVAQPLAPGWWDGGVCYEVFVRSFFDSDGNGIGDLKGLIEKLDYINDGDPATASDLGATCIWLMPIAEASSYHGYDTVDYYTVDRDYGTNEDFKTLVTEAKRRGIAVIIDLVLNHVSHEHPWFLDAVNNPSSPYRDWFIWAPTSPGYSGPWGEPVWHRSPRGAGYYYGIFTAGMPDLNYRNPEVTAEAQRIARFWLEEMGVDGFRLDAIKHVIENGQEQENTRETYAWLREYQAALRMIKPDVFTIGEIFGGRPGVLDGYYPDQLDAYFEFDIGDGIMGATNSRDARDLMRPALAAYRGLPFQRYAPFLTNHDLERAMTTMGGDQGRARIAAIALLTMPGLPFIYYGEEIGMTGMKPDERLRTPMQWSGDPGGGFSSGTPWESLQGNAGAVHVAAQTADPRSLLSLYRTLIRLHTTTPALATGSFSPLESPEHPEVAAYVRRAGDDAALVVINLGTDPANEVVLTAETSDLKPGVYRLEALLGDARAVELVVSEGGAIVLAAPIAQLAPQAGYIFRLIP